MSIRCLSVPRSGVARATPGGAFRGWDERCERDCSHSAARIENDDRTRMPATRQNPDSPSRPAETPTQRTAAPCPRYYIAATGQPVFEGIPASVTNAPGIAVGNKSGLYRQCAGAGKPGNELRPFAGALPIRPVVLSRGGNG